MPKRSRIQLLPDKKFWEMYERCCPAIKNAKDEKVRKMVYDELNRLDDILRPAIDARWKETDAYYEFNDDWNVSWHHSMGVYSDQMCCTEFLDIVQRSLSKMEHDWCFHVALECDQDMGWGLQRAEMGRFSFTVGTSLETRKPSLIMHSLTANHALQRTRHERRGCNSRVLCAGSLSLGR
jgi:hypothetical protein